MPETDAPDDANPPPQDAEKVLVCGVCKEILPERFEHEGDADAAADEHVEEEHPEEAPVIVLPAPAPLAQTEPNQLVRIASQAQADLEAEPDIGFDPIGSEMGGGEGGSEIG